MATATVAPETQGARDRRVDAWRVVRWLTLLLYVLTLLGAVFGGAKEGAYADLQSALQLGEVDQVRVEGALDGPRGYAGDTQGVSTVRLEWRDGWHRSFTEVWQASSMVELITQGFDASGAHIIGDVGQELRGLSPGLEIVRADRQSGIYGSFGGWEVRGAWAYLPLALLVGCVAVIANFPEPRLGTRWAWVWMVLSPALIVAAPAYLILGARPHTVGRWRLNGIGAFLIFMVLIGGAGEAG